jgi:hypothetical protein
MTEMHKPHTASVEDLPFPQPEPDATRPARPPKRCRRHEWAFGKLEPIRPGDPLSVRVAHAFCLRCGKLRDEAAVRRGKSSDRLGKDQERRIERLYGPRKVGQFGSAVDHLGRDYKWQSKASRSLPPRWLARIIAPTWWTSLPKSILEPLNAMDALYPTLKPLVIRSYVRQGVATRDWVFVMPSEPWVNPETPYLVYPGTAWLDLFGRDEP